MGGEGSAKQEENNKRRFFFSPCFLLLPKAVTHADKLTMCAHHTLKVAQEALQGRFVPRQIFTCWSISSVAFSFS